MHDQDTVTDNEKQQTCENKNCHIRAVPQESSIQRQKRHTGGHNKTVSKSKAARQRLDLH